MKVTNDLLDRMVDAFYQSCFEQPQWDSLARSIARDDMKVVLRVFIQAMRDEGAVAYLHHIMHWEGAVYPFVSFTPDGYPSVDAKPIDTSALYELPEVDE